MSDLRDVNRSHGTVRTGEFSFWGENLFVVEYTLFRLMPVYLNNSNHLHLLHKVYDNRAPYHVMGNLH